MGQLHEIAVGGQMGAKQSYSLKYWGQDLGYQVLPFVIATDLFHIRASPAYALKFIE